MAGSTGYRAIAAANMELGMRFRCGHHLPPNTSKPLPRAIISAGAWRLCSSSSSHDLAVLPGRRPLPRRAGALQVAAPDSPRPLETTTCANNIGQQDTKLREDKFCLVEMEVRDCELNQLGLVNSAVYADYLEHAREEVSSRLGIGRDWIVRTGNAMALSQLNLNYFTPLKRGDRFVVMVRVIQIKGARMVVEHFIETLPERKLVLEATATVTFLNKDYRPTRVFPEVASKMLLHFF